MQEARTLKHHNLRNLSLEQIFFTTQDLQKDEIERTELTICRVLCVFLPFTSMFNICATSFEKIVASGVVVTGSV
jgi:hypothetical protein